MTRRIRFLSLLASAWLASCGGGMVAGVGSGGSGVAEGTLSGFGSVIVDGIEYSESGLSATDRAGLKLGQRVRLVFDATGAARSIDVRPQLRGPVTAPLDADGFLRIGGQWVRVVQSNDDFSRSGITLLEGFASAGIATGQDATAYGSWVWDASKSAHVLVATRIDRLAEVADPVLIGGVVASLADGRLRLAAADGTVVTAARLPVLAEGAIVAVEVARAGLLVEGGTVAAVSAAEVKDASLGASDLSGFDTVRLGGLANGYDMGRGTVTIQGTQLRLGMDPGGLAAGRFVRATAGGGPGDLTAAAVQGRFGSPVGRPGDDGSGLVTELKGTLSGVDWSAPTVGFVLRGVTVQADAAQVGAACRTAAAGQTLYVTVVGYSPAPTAPVRANVVNCSADLTAAAADV